MYVGSDGREPNAGHLVDWAGREYGWARGQGWILTGSEVTGEPLNEIRRANMPATGGPSGQPLYIDGQLLYIDPAHPPVPYLHPPTIPRVNGLARTARVFSWLGLLSLPFGIIGLILGYMALGRIASDDAESRSVAKTAIIVGWIFTVLTVVLVLWILSDS
jgi:hypothetical protein